jgi:hypothetical protein
VITVVLVVSLGVIGGAYLGYHFGRLSAADEIARRARGGDEEVTGVQCARCLRDVRECKCAAAVRGRA